MRESDLEDYVRFAADEEVMRYMGGTLDRVETWRQLAMLIGHWDLRGFGLWSLVLQETGELVGRIGFHQPEGWPGFEMGWMLGRDYWGRGYALEAGRVVMDYGFRELKKDHIISVIHPDNEPSIRLAQRLGETREGDTEVRGIYVHIYGIGRDDYDKRSKKQ